MHFPTYEIIVIGVVHVKLCTCPWNSRMHLLNPLLSRTYVNFSFSILRLILVVEQEMTAFIKCHQRKCIDVLSV